MPAEIYSMKNSESPSPPSRFYARYILLTPLVSAMPSIYADRMLELDKIRETATYAEELIHYFREARREEPGKEKYALDLIFSLSLASSCLACTERAGDVLEYAKQAVELQHERKDTGDGRYDAHLRKLLMDVIFRSVDGGARGSLALDPGAEPSWQLRRNT